MPWLYRQRGSRFWWIGWRDAQGKQHLRSTKCEDKPEAQKVLSQFQLTEKARHLGRLSHEFFASLTNGSRPITLQDALNDWLRTIEPSVSAATLASYRSVGRRLSKEFPGAMLGDIGLGEVRRFLDARNASTNTWNKRRSCLCGFWKHCTESRLALENPVEAIKQRRRGNGPRSRRQAFTPQQVTQLLTAAPNRFWYWLILVGYHSGQRLGDNVCARVEDLNLENALWRFIQIKTGFETAVPLASPVVTFLQNRELPKAGPIWPEEAQLYRKKGAGPFSSEFKIILDKCGFSGGEKGPGGRTFNPLSYHSLRHSFLTQLKEAGASEYEAKELAGHRSSAVGAVYTHGDIERLRVAVNRLELPDAGQRK